MVTLRSLWWRRGGTVVALWWHWDDTVFIVVALWWHCGHCGGTVFFALHCSGTVVTVLILWSLWRHFADIFGHCDDTVVVLWSMW